MWGSVFEEMTYLEYGARELVAASGNVKVAS